MATVNDVRLTIQKGGGGQRRLVTVKYKVCFSGCEVLAGSTFVADVYLRGDDPIWDDHLIRLSHGCVKAARGCPEFSLQRSVSRSTLDEDGDTIIEIFGVKLLEIADRDEVYARVELRPFQAVGDAANSNVVTGQWGSAGGD